MLAAGSAATQSPTTFYGDPFTMPPRAERAVATALQPSEVGSAMPASMHPSGCLCMHVDHTRVRTVHNTCLGAGWMDHGWINGWMDGWMAGWLDGWMDGWMAGWMDAPTCTCMYPHVGHCVVDAAVKPLHAEPHYMSVAWHKAQPPHVHTDLSMQLCSLTDTRRF